MPGPQVDATLVVAVPGRGGRQHGATVGHDAQPDHSNVVGGRVADQQHDEGEHPQQVQLLRAVWFRRAARL